MEWPDVLTRLGRRESLDEVEAESVLACKRPRRYPSQIGAFLTLSPRWRG